MWIARIFPTALGAGQREPSKWACRHPKRYPECEQSPEIFFSAWQGASTGEPTNEDETTGRGCQRKGHLRLQGLYRLPKTGGPRNELKIAIPNGLRCRATQVFAGAGYGGGSGMHRQFTATGTVNGAKLVFQFSESLHQTSGYRVSDSVADAVARLSPQGKGAKQFTSTAQLAGADYVRLVGVGGEACVGVRRLGPVTGQNFKWILFATRCQPKGLGLGRADIHAEHFASPVCIDGDGDDDGDRDDAAGLADLHVGGVDPQIGPVALDRSVEEGLTRWSISSHRRLTWLL